MPNLGGAETARLLGLERPGIGVLFISGYSWGESLPPTDPMKAVAYLEKPFDTKTLEARVAELLESRARLRGAEIGCAFAVGKLRARVYSRRFMSERDFFSDEAKRATAASVRSAEAQTSAEIVVAVRKSSGRYGVLAYHFGLGLSALVVGYLLVAPELYSAFAIALDGIVAFGLGSLLAANLDTVQRALSRGSTLDENVNRGARVGVFRPGHFPHLGPERPARVRFDVRTPLRRLDRHWHPAEPPWPGLGRLRT